MLTPGNGTSVVSESEFNDNIDHLMMARPSESKDLFDYIQKNERQVSQRSDDDPLIQLAPPCGMLQRISTPVL